MDLLTEYAILESFATYLFTSYYKNHGTSPPETVNSLGTPIREILPYTPQHRIKWVINTRLKLNNPEEVWESSRQITKMQRKEEFTAPDTTSLYENTVSVLKSGDESKSGVLRVEWPEDRSTRLFLWPGLTGGYSGSPTHVVSTDHDGTQSTG